MSMTASMALKLPEDMDSQMKEDAQRRGISYQQWVRDAIYAKLHGGATPIRSGGFDPVELARAMNDLQERSHGAIGTSILDGLQTVSVGFDVVAALIEDRESDR